MKLKHNKAFKWDLARVAFSVCVEFGGYGTCGSFCIACLHPLTQRYTNGGSFESR
ncbi:TPA: DUF3265 domain-containing protein [Vibrio cholerae]|nr:DUF3265 domain-containing protein [Vibrio cholerae]HEQ3507624.1 DUF3265 domain-containing protein [Vibrio cholerae]HEQ3576174.1 DUF3265 domain-containing protein [Vibrio cholerae]